MFEQPASASRNDRNLDEAQLIERTGQQQGLDETDAVNANRLAGLRLQFGN